MSKGKDNLKSDTNHLLKVVLEAGRMPDFLAFIKKEEYKKGLLRGSIYGFIVGFLLAGIGAALIAI